MLEKLLLIAALSTLVLGASLVGGCGDDDDDDDLWSSDDDDDSTATDCENFFMTCHSNTLEEAQDNCNSFYNYEDACYIDAADAFFSCLGTNCDQGHYDDCSVTYTDDANNCA